MSLLLTKFLWGFISTKRIRYEILLNNLFPNSALFYKLYFAQNADIVAHNHLPCFGNGVPR
ncbi:hypothetical protein BDE36_2261 [Arcticibacter tournemirensis]|nr:hypothetical protein BDE36_2261 [Arcticibacter tournemirensis]